MALCDLSQVIVVEFNIFGIKFVDEIRMKRLAGHEVGTRVMNMNINMNINIE